MKARVSHLHKNEASWNKLAEWIPEAGEFVIFDPDEHYNYARIKIGDGRTPLKNLAFSVEKAIENELSKHRFETVIDAGRITDYV